MDRDVVTEFVDRVKVRGLAYLVLLYMLNGATVGELHLMCDEDRHTISDTLRALELRQFVLRVQVGRSETWRISAIGLQMLRLDGGIPTNNAPTTTTALLSSPPTTKAAVAAAVDGGIPTNNGGHRVAPKLAAAFRAAGIGSNAWVELAKLKYVTVAYVKAHDEYRRVQGESTGLLITRLKCGDPVPDLRTKAEIEDARMRERFKVDAARYKRAASLNKKRRK
jgi:hypothetical protein